MSQSCPLPAKIIARLTWKTVVMTRYFSHSDLFKREVRYHMFYLFYRFFLCGAPGAAYFRHCHISHISHLNLLPPRHSSAYNAGLCQFLVNVFNRHNAETLKILHPLPDALIPCSNLHLSNKWAKWMVGLRTLSP